MWHGVLQAAGGLGLFLLGMAVMTDGLKALAGDKLRNVLSRTTGSPVSGACTGAIATAVIQSSSATTVAAVGFVHAGLLTFSQSLGIIFGANIGTTITGWLVALVGFKLKLGESVLPLIFVGMLLRLVGKGTLREAGTALAGFGLIFVGISTLQGGMAAFEGSVTPDSFPPDTLGGRVLLVLVGALITLVTQSSSAGVATALAAVHAGTITLPQAAAMVIGMDFGTTVTAVMATIGSNVQARRTGFAHVIYNALTAVMAFTLLSPFLHGVGAVLPGAAGGDPELVLVGFHTFFNGLGVILILPFTRQFARLIEEMFPERGNPLTRRLDPDLQSTPQLALPAVKAALEDVVRVLFRALYVRLDNPNEDWPDDLDDVDGAIATTRAYLEHINVNVSDETLLDDYLRAGHILDHVQRVSTRLRRESRLQRVRDDVQLAEMGERLADAAQALSDASFPISEDVASFLQTVSQELKPAMRVYRVRSLRRTATGRLETRTALKRMDTARWLRRLAHHAWRIADHASATPITLNGDSVATANTASR